LLCCEVGKDDLGPSHRFRDAMNRRLYTCDRALRHSTSLWSFTAKLQTLLLGSDCFLRSHDSYPSSEKFYVNFEILYKENSERRSIKKNCRRKFWGDRDFG